MTDAMADIVALLRIGLLGKLALGVVLGGAVGLEREVRGKAAGLRTNILICLGAVLFTDLSITIAGPGGDPGRIAAQIVTGVDFLGAGTILQSRGTITGLTSAATIWLVAAIGVAVGMGATLEAAGATLLVLLVLAALGALERRLSRGALVRHLTVEIDGGTADVDALQAAVRAGGLRVQSLHARHRQHGFVVDLVVRGSDRDLEVVTGRLLDVGRAVRIVAED